MSGSGKREDHDGDQPHPGRSQHADHGHKQDHAHDNSHGQHGHGQNQHRNDHGHGQQHRNDHGPNQHKNDHGQNQHRNDHGQNQHRNDHGPNQHKNDHGNGQKKSAHGHGADHHDNDTKKNPQSEQPTDGAKKKGKKWEPSDDAGNDELEFELPKAATVTKKKGLLFVVIGVVLVAVLILLGFIPKWREHSTVNKEADQETKAKIRVELVTPKAMKQSRPLELPGIIQALEETVVYPRATGYVRRWLVDIGDQVKEGQLLAEIDTPDLDAQIDQARADLAQAEASEARSETSAALSTTEQKRYETLTPAGVTTGQELESRRTQARVDDANIKVAKATVVAQQAALNRLTRLKSFARPIAPFTGTITARTIERGQLVTPATTSPMFRIAALDPVRIFVQVPQDVAPSVRTGTRSDVAIREFPGKLYEGTVARAAGALDDATRTMTTEIRVPNSRHELLPGMYVKAVLNLDVPHRVFEVPSTALYIDSNGVRIATVDSEGTVELRKVNIERDTGAFIQISQGLDGTERVVKISNAALTTGSKVDIIETKPAADDKSQAKPPEKTPASQPLPARESGATSTQKDGDKAGGKGAATVKTKTESDTGAEASPVPGGAPKHEAEPGLREMKPTPQNTQPPQKPGPDPHAPE